jgi:DEAD/DEAH box helicase domain-containing protein
LTSADTESLSFLQNAVFEPQIAHIEELPPRDAVYREPRSAFHPQLQERLKELGIDRLYSHQADAYDAAMAGQDVIAVTGTNSGKTLCYNLPAIQWSLTEPAARMLYLFPTKALAQDQLGRLEQLLPGSFIRAGTYDGDTPKSQRGPLRRLAHIVMTNPDMLHVGILPGHEQWTKFLKALKLIVIDEMHVYRGVFGSNVSGVLRRLLRLCEWHRTHPQIVACSATIGNPAELFEKLTGRKGLLLDEDGSPRAKRTFVFWNPPLIGENQRLSTNVVTSEIMTTLAESGQRVLAFNRARVSAELVLRYARKRAESGGIVAPKKIESYRAGYTPKERRHIEQALFKGDLLGLAATNAMELGVDVGGLDAVVMNGYPGTVASFYQQAGRAGRGTRPGLAIMVAHDDPLEQFLIRRPEMVMNARNESVALNPENPTILSNQLLCAAHERPLAPSELGRFGASAVEVAESLDRAGELEFRAGLFFYPSHDPPAARVNIRGSGGEEVTLVLDGEPLGSMERWRAMQSAHEGAVYLHRGASYVVMNLDLEARRAQVVPMDVGYYTQAMVQSVIEQNVSLRSEAHGNVGVSLCGIKVTSLVTGYRKKALDGDTVLSVEALDMPPDTYDTLAVRFDMPPLTFDENLTAEMAGVHGLEHALMAIAPLMAGCDRADLGSAWYAAFQDTMQPAVFVFDSTPGGVGLAETLYASVPGWVRGAIQLLASCDCEEGCPACLYSPRCEANNEHLDKARAVAVLRGIAQG